MEPITININLNLSDEHVSQICGAIGCLAQLVDLASRTSGTPFSAADLLAPGGVIPPEPEQYPPADIGKGEVDPVMKNRKVKPKEPEKPKASEEPKKPEHTTDDVRNLVINLTHGGYKKEAAAIVHKYAPKVTEVPESALDELYAALEQLGGNDGTDA